ncbi:uncharacterized protein LOC119453257 [Dermacentor silvarum]|uniref:uncharacterized protein LOC119453257 n=1 Tax=Dermacentor silvarum TaxID=543639 RepID=UPI00210195B0|nr:uncharacterized protein LOC119453257 [Dermacentor silvarum]
MRTTGHRAERGANLCAVSSGQDIKPVDEGTATQTSVAQPQAIRQRWSQDKPWPPHGACRFSKGLHAEPREDDKSPSNERVVPETFYIIEQSVPVTLSGSVAERLGFICRVQHIEVDELYPPAQPFAEVFSGLGELKGYEYEIKLKPGAVGVIVPARIIPVALEGKTRAEFQRMEDQGVITKLRPQKFSKQQWHRVLEGLSCVAVVMDDVLVWGRTKDEHDYSLKLVLSRCQQHNLRLNPKKSAFLQPEVRYLGHILTTEGLRLDPERVEDILGMPEPSNKKELQVFLGTMNFVQRFIPNMSVVTAPLRTLLRKDIAWVWTEAQQKSFDTLRQSLTKAPVLAFFNPKKPFILSVDARQSGVGAVLMQDGRPIAFSSRSLTEAQQNYAQIEKEMLAIVHGCTKFHDYVFGQAEVIVETDHRPLVPILSKPLHQCPLRLQRMRLTLQRYPIKLVYKPGKELFLADALSRFPSKVSMCEETDQFQVNVLEFVSASEARLKSILAATNNDTVLSQLREYALTSWPDNKHEVPEVIRPYWPYQEEIHAQDGLLFRSNKVIKEFRHNTANQLKSWCAELFSVHGLPLKLCSDNRPPFNSTEFKDLLYGLAITHVTSSPYHPRSNGMTERAVQEAKKLLKNCSLRTPDFHMALLEWRNTPRDAVLKSPVQRLMGRQTRTLLPVPASHLVPEIVPNRAVHNRLQEIRQRQRIYYNRHSRDLPPLSPGQIVTAYDTHEKTWAPAVFLRPAETPRSVVLKTEEGQEIRRTREHLREALSHPEESPCAGSERLDDAQPAQELRRSTRPRREPCRYPQPERPL